MTYLETLNVPDSGTSRIMILHGSGLHWRTVKKVSSKFHGNPTINSLLASGCIDQYMDDILG